MRCSDPTEGGSLASAVRCQACRSHLFPKITSLNAALHHIPLYSTGLLLPASSLDLGAPWVCRGPGAQGGGCGAAIEPHTVSDLEEELERVLEEVSMEVYMLWYYFS